MVKQERRRRAEQEREAQRTRLKGREAEIRAREAAKRAEQQSGMKRRTLAPLPRVNKRHTDIPLDKFKFQNKAMSITEAAFKADDYVKRFIIKCDGFNMNDFDDKYIVWLIHADSIYQFAHDQLYSLALDPERLMQELFVIFQMPAGLADRGKQYYTWNFLKFFMQMAYKEYHIDLMENKGWEAMDYIDVLCAYFRTWFFHRPLGAILCARAYFTINNYQFAGKANTGTSTP